jgi:hypothetical protein
MGVEDPTVPFRSVPSAFKQADFVFCNLECCLYDPPVQRKMMADEVSGYEGFFAPPASGSLSSAASVRQHLTAELRPRTDHGLQRVPHKLGIARWRRRQRNGRPRPWWWAQR